MGLREQHHACHETTGTSNKCTDLDELGSVLVAQRQQKQQVLNAIQAEILEFLCKRRPNAAPTLLALIQTARNRVGLNIDVFGQRRYTHRRSRREGLFEEIFHDSVDGREVVEVRQKIVRLYDIVQTAACGFGDGFQIRKHLPCTRLKITVNNLHRVGNEWDLSGRNTSLPARIACE